MKTPASIQSHPIHAILIAFPLGLWTFSFVCDLFYKFMGGEGWRLCAVYTMAGGIAGALLAAVPGLIDYLNVKKRSEQIKKIGAFHMVLNVSAVVLYAVNLYLRFHSLSLKGPMILSFVTLLLLTISGWLGGEMVYVHRVGVQERLEEEHERLKAA